MENRPSIDFELGSPCLRTYSHNYYTMLWGVFNIYISIFKVFEQTWRPFTSPKLYKLSKNPHSASRVASNSNKTNQHLLNLLQTNTPLTLNYALPPPHTLHCCAVVRGMNSRNKEWNSSTGQIGLTLVLDSLEIASKTWMARWYPRAPGFQPKQ